MEVRLGPTYFSPDELKQLQGASGCTAPRRSWPSCSRAELISSKRRASTLDRLREMKPVILRRASAHQVNPMLITAVLFDEIQHSKPGESLPFIAHSGLVKTHGPEQICVSELIHLNRLP